jgi:hypothetical protein
MNGFPALEKGLALATGRAAMRGPARAERTGARCTRARTRFGPERADPTTAAASRAAAVSLCHELGATRNFR